MSRLNDMRFEKILREVQTAVRGVLVDKLHLIILYSLFINLENIISKSF